MLLLSARSTAAATVAAVGGDGGGVGGGQRLVLMVVVDQRVWLMRFTYFDGLTYAVSLCLKVTNVSKKKKQLTIALHRDLVDRLWCESWSPLLPATSFPNAPVFVVVVPCPPRPSSSLGVLFFVVVFFFFVVLFVVFVSFSVLVLLPLSMP